MNAIFAIIFLLLLTGCGADQSDTERILTVPSQVESSESAERNINMNFDLTSSSTQLFHGYPCTADCSGHTAGYEWADEEGIEDTNDCTGNSQSFIEGCEAYVKEQTEESDEDNE